MSYSGGRWVIVKLENETVYLESWNSPKQEGIRTIPLKDWPAGFPECRAEVQLLLKIKSDNRSTWTLPKRQIRDRVIYDGSSIDHGH